MCGTGRSGRGTAVSDPISVWQAEALLKIASRWWDKGPVQVSSTAKSVVFIFSVSVPVPCLPANIYIYFFFGGGDFLCF